MLRAGPAFAFYQFGAQHADLRDWSAERKAPNRRKRTNSRHSVMGGGVTVAKSAACIHAMS